MRTGGSLRGIGTLDTLVGSSSVSIAPSSHTRELVEQPVRGRTEALLMLLSVHEGQSGFLTKIVRSQPGHKRLLGAKSRTQAFSRVTYGPRPMIAVLSEVSGRRSGPWAEDS